jgi:hypothetical protein
LGSAFAVVGLAVPFAKIWWPEVVGPLLAHAAAALRAAVPGNPLLVVGVVLGLSVVGFALHERRFARMELPPPKAHPLAAR